MTDQPILQGKTVETVTLNKGDVALVMRGSDDGYYIAHNIEAIERQEGLSNQNGEVLNVVVILTLLELMKSDEAAFSAAMIRVVNGLQGGTLSLVQ